MPDQVEMLRNIAHEYRKKKKMSNERKEETLSALEALFREPERLETACDIYASIPADIAAKSFYMAWKESGDEHRLDMTRSIIDSSRLKGTAGYNRQVELIKLFAPTSQEMALFFLTELARNATALGTKVPSSRLATKFRSMLIEKGDMLGLPLETYPINSDERKAILILAVFSMLSVEASRSAKYRGKYLSLLSWLEQPEQRLEIKADIKAEIEKKLKGWPEDLQRKCRDMELVGTITYFVDKGEEIKKKDEKAGIRDEREGTGEDQILPSKATVGYERQTEPRRTSASVPDTQKSKIQETVAGRDELSVISDIFFDMRRLMNKLFEDIKKRHEAEMRKKQAELEGVSEKSKELVSAVRRLEDIRKDCMQKIKALENEKEILENELDSAKLKAETVEKDHEEEKKKMSSQAGKISVMNQEELRNRVAAALQFHFREFEETENMEMDAEIGDHLRHLVRGIFRTLKANGIWLGEGAQ